MHDENKKKLQSWQHNNSIYFLKKNPFFTSESILKLVMLQLGKIKVFLFVLQYISAISYVF